MRLVILDRDGVINRDSPAYIKSPEEWLPIPGSLESIAELSRAGYTIVVCTNQSGISRGLFEWPTLNAIHEKMIAAVATAGGHIDSVFVCPHGPDDQCPCRKPKPGLLLQIAAHYRVPLKGVPVVGDSARDIDAARLAGARPILVLTGNGPRTLADRGSDGIEVFEDLRGVARALVGQAGTAKNESK